MKHFTFALSAALSALLLAAPASAQSVGEKTGVNSTLGISPSTSDFVLQATISDMFEIKSSELATQKGDQATKDFAAHMIEGHKKTTEELKAAVQASGGKLTLPTEMDDTHKDKIGKLTDLKDGDFNDQYHSDQEKAHEDAVSLFQRYAESGEDKGLKEWAGKTLPALKEHLKMAEALNG